MKRTRLDGKRSVVKSLIFGFIFLMLLIALIGSCSMGEDEKPIKEPETQATAPEVQEDEEAVKRAEEEIKQKQEQEVEKAKEAQTQLENEALALLQENFEGAGTVEFDKESKVFLITSTDPSFMEEVQMIASGQAPMGVWNELLDSMAYLSSSVSGVLGQGYTVAMVNPLNTDRLLIIVEDGSVTYDVMQDSQAAPL